jgi:23S rRNA pseudouridine955/2504/2580 synthase
VNGPADYWKTLPLGRDVQLLTHDPRGLAAFNKPAGVLSHPNRIAEEPRSLLTGHYDAEHECFVWSDAAGKERRLWLLNRLDSATSGVILTAASAELARTIRLHFAMKMVRKVYLALVFGKPPGKHAMWRDLLAVAKSHGKIRTKATAGNVPSVTDFQFIRHLPGEFPMSLVRLEPHTGRSHQLRVQCAKRRLPIVGDQTYGDFPLNRAYAKATGSKRLFLHSFETSFTYEFAGKPHDFKAVAPPPAEFPGMV